jgi:cobalt-zinc-cadmium resistance protein CzcA
MIRAIIAWSLHNRLIVLLATLGLIGMGSHAALHLNVEAYPDPTPPLVEVIAQNSGASPEEMERLVGIPLETALNGMPGLEDLRSVSIAGLTSIKCQFRYGTDYQAARQEVLNRINSIDTLPNGVRPELSPWSPTGEIVRYVLEGPGYTLHQLKALQDWVLEKHFKQVPGVVDVTGFGGTVKQYQVLLDTQRMREYGVTFNEVERAIDGSNANVGANNMMLGSQSHNVRVIGLLGGGVDPLDPARVSDSFMIETDKLEDINNVVVASHGGVPIFVRQIAKVIVGHQPRFGIVGRNLENDVVEGIVLMRKGEKSLPTSEAVQAKIDELNSGTLLPKGVRIVPFNRRTDLVHVTTHNVLHNLLVGMGLVVLVLFMFLGDIPSAAIVALVVPLALLFAISVLFFQGKSANLLSIGAVDFGIIVDSAVIIVETIYHQVTHSATAGQSINQKIDVAARRVGRPILFSTMIIVCAFLPLFVMSGPAGALFGPMANTYAFSILGALLVAMTLVPVLCSFFFRNKTHDKPTILDRVLQSLYQRTLRLALRVRYLVLFALVGLFVWTISLIPGLGAEFMPELEEGNLWIRALMPRTASLDEAARMAPRIREVISSVPEVRGVMSHVGRPDDGTDVTSFFNLEFNVPLRPMDEWRPGMTRVMIEAELQRKFERFPGVAFGFSQLIRDNVEEALSGVKGANSVKLFGNELDTLEQVARKVSAELEKVPGIENVGVFHIVGQPTLEIRIDRKACARLGVNVADVEAVVQVAVGGRAFTQMVEGEKLYDIVLRLPQSARDDPADIALIPVDVPGHGDQPGPRVPLSSLATIEPHKSGASYVYRENNRRYIPIKFSIHGRDLASAISDAQKRIELPAGGVSLLPPGYEIEWSGEFAQMQEANAALAVTVPISILLIMVLLYTMFSSVKDALIVMAGVLTAAMGGVWALVLTHTTFSISAAVGFISIFGVVVQNGVLLVNDFNRMRGMGVSVNETVIQGSTRLLRPVLMISLTAILGLLPAALATSIGSQAQKPLAIVVVGGMSAAMILPQFLIPILYQIFPAPTAHEVQS